MEIWSSLSHPNILPIVGFCTIPEGRIAFVSHFMDGGSAFNHVCSHPDADLAVLVSTGQGLLLLGLAHEHTLKSVAKSPKD